MRYWLSKMREKALVWIVWHLPRPIVYWSAIRVGAHATTGLYSNQIVPDLTYMDALKRWDDKGLHWAIRLRKVLLIRGSWKWNAWVRDITARLER